jgi:hypothetical protein
MAETAAAAAVTGRSALSLQSLHLRVNEKVTLDTLQAILAKIGGMTGCTRCGLLGVDLRITGDPVEAHQFQLPGVVSISH